MTDRGTKVGGVNMAVGETSSQFTSLPECDDVATKNQSQ